MIRNGFGEYHMNLLAKTAETTERIKAVIDLDSTLTQKEISDRIGVSVNAVGKILRKIKQEV